MNTTTPCGPGELGPVCDGSAQGGPGGSIASSPTPDPTAVVAQAGDPMWYLTLDLAGTWLSAFGTIAAAVVAAWLGLRAVREQRALQEERERAQAERVALILTSRRAPDRPSLRLQNESDRLISAVRVVALGSLEDEVHDIDLIPADIGVDIGMSGLTSQSSTAVVEFDDASGRTWVRTSQGALRRAHRKANGTSLHLRYRTDGRPELASITVSLQRGAMLLAYQQKAEPDPAAAAPVRRTRKMIGTSKTTWARWTRNR